MVFEPVVAIFASLSWSQTGAEVSLVWKECDRPPVNAPERGGFDSPLLSVIGIVFGLVLFEPLMSD